VSSKRRRQDSSSRPAYPPTAAGSNRPGFLPSTGEPSDMRTRVAFIVVVAILVAIVVIAADLVLGAIAGTSGAAGPTGANSSPAATSTTARATAWTNVGANQLADMLGHKDFTLVNVKTPYIGEIDGTDLYIPYDQLTTRTAELPKDKTAKVLVYCRSGVQSAQAAQTLLDLGYTNVWNLDGGMNAWTASGRSLIQKNR
jgi:rhodanese-related sulfurtransferase